MNLWLLLVLLGAVTMAERLSFILWAGQRDMPAWLERSLRYVPASVLSALIVPGILRTNGALDLGLLNPKLIAGCAAVLLAWRTKNVTLTVVVGMALFWGMEWLL